MKLTKNLIKKLIHEELNYLKEETHSEPSDEEIEAGKKLADPDNPVGRMIFKMLDQDPSVQAALKSAMKESNLSETEGFGNVARQAAVLGGMGLAAANAEAIKMAGWSAATKAAPAIKAAVLAMGLPATAAVGSIIVGYLLYKTVTGGKK